MIVRILLLIFTMASSAFAQTNSPISTNFVLQVLEPTGGIIQRPKDWFYSEGHHGSTYVWTLSRENTAGGSKPYVTGVRIQTFVGVKDAGGKTAKEFVLDFIQKKKKEAANVLKSCPENNEGLFTRVCLETEEGPYHILYSVFWGNDNLDIAVISIAGTTKELWATYSPVFDKMAHFALIDMTRFQK